MPQSWGEGAKTKRGTAQIDREKERARRDAHSDERGELSIQRRRSELSERIAQLLQRALDVRYRR